MNQASPLVVHVPTINEIKFRTPKFAQGFDEVFHAVFPTASYFPPIAEWSVRVTDEKYSEAITLIDAIFDNFYPGEYPELSITVHQPQIHVHDFAETLPNPLRRPAKPVRYQVPEGSFYGAIAV